MLGAFATLSGRLFHGVSILIPQDFCLTCLNDLCRYTLSGCSLASCICATAVESLINDVASLS